MIRALRSRSASAWRDIERFIASARETSLTSTRSTRMPHGCSAGSSMTSLSSAEVLAASGRTSSAFAALAQRLRASQVVALVCDRDVTGRGMEVEFFGGKARMMGGPAALAVQTGAALMPVILWFEGDGLGRAGWRIGPSGHTHHRFEPAGPDQPGQRVAQPQRGQLRPAGLQRAQDAHDPHPVSRAGVSPLAGALLLPSAGPSPRSF
jgi:Bacterial lipid A biosynthesis acyltransferase